MGRYFLADHVHCCATEDGSVLLDLRTERYLGLSRECSRLLATVVEDWPPCARASMETSREDPTSAVSLAEGLLRRGLLSQTPTLRPDHGGVLVEPCREIGYDEVSDCKPDWRHIPVFCIAWLNAAWQMRFLRLETITRGIARRKSVRSKSGAFGSVRSPKISLRQAAAIFMRLRPLVFTSRDACLLDSLMLTEFLARHGWFPDLHIGVTTQPFAAHSWVQQGDTVLNDSVERIRAFTTILRI